LNHALAKAKQMRFLICWCLLFIFCLWQSPFKKEAIFLVIVHKKS